MVDFDKEPCPECGYRIKPIKVGAFKKCPLCGFTWYESGGGTKQKTLSCM
ncbi:MAG: hypothetical protein QXG39_08720 [Candidatus Aenigmatarchaeota archaeon]